MLRMVVFIVAALIMVANVAPAWAATNPGYEGQPGNQSSNQGQPGNNGSNQAGPTGYEGQPGNQSHN